MDEIKLIYKIIEIFGGQNIDINSYNSSSSTSNLYFTQLLIPTMKIETTPTISVLVPSAISRALGHMEC